MKGYRAVFADVPGQLGGGGVIRFEGPGEPMPRRRLTWDQRRRKRARAKALRKARRRASA